MQSEEELDRELVDEQERLRTQVDHLLWENCQVDTQLEDLNKKKQRILSEISWLEQGQGCLDKERERNHAQHQPYDDIECAAVLQRLRDTPGESELQR